MNKEEVNLKLLSILSDIALDDEVEKLDPTTELKDQLDIDSMDFLDIVMEVKRNFGIVIPQEDYSQVTTLENLSQYIVSRSTQAA